MSSNNQLMKVIAPISRRSTKSFSFNFSLTGLNPTLWVTVVWFYIWSIDKVGECNHSKTTDRKRGRFDPMTVAPTNKKAEIGSWRCWIYISWLSQKCAPLSTYSTVADWILWLQTARQSIFSNVPTGDLYEWFELRFRYRK